MHTIQEADELRKDLESKYGEVYTTSELQEHFEVQAFAFGMVVVVRKSDRVKGVMEFTHMPRFYYAFAPTNL